uniref:SRCR domain-containing protein n=1 Tax=Branchiostoma floridae TaxID=7739 RepID=C3ZFX5_BRAFL|eukprot:XP_002592602.1 hypothetical protein BRAFLDRAFT_68925 [Branchiostoma floridae]
MSAWIFMIVAFSCVIPSGSRSKDDLCEAKVQGTKTYAFVGRPQFNSPIYRDGGALQPKPDLETTAMDKNGKTCQRWDSQTPHTHNKRPDWYPVSGLEQNFCRNPDGKPAVWCHTTDPGTTWEYCDVTICGILLVGGSSPSEGRVEVYYDGQWGTVCDDEFDINDAHVICRQLGYGGAAEVKSAADFGTGSGQIWLDNLACGGSESSIEYCRHNGWGSHNCGHGEDAGVVCSDATLYSCQPTPTRTCGLSGPPLIGCELRGCCFDVDIFSSKPYGLWCLFSISSDQLLRIDTMISPERLVKNDTAKLVEVFYPPLVIL